MGGAGGGGGGGGEEGCCGQRLLGPRPTGPALPSCGFWWAVESQVLPEEGIVRSLVGSRLLPPTPGPVMLIGDAH